MMLIHVWKILSMKLYQQLNASTLERTHTCDDSEHITAGALHSDLKTSESSRDVNDAASTSSLWALAAAERFQWV